MSKAQTLYRTIQSNGFEWLEPIYWECSHVLNQILEDKNLCHQLTQLPLKKRNKKGQLVNRLNGEIWKDMNALIGNRLIGKVPNSAWYMRIVYDNLIALLKSRKDQLKIYEILQQNNFQINTRTWDELHNEKLYPTRVNLQNLCKAKTMPELPDKACFRLDYSSGSSQMFKWDPIHLIASVQVLSAKDAKKMGVSAWHDFKVVLPTYVRDQFAGKVAKPMFYYSKKYKHLVANIAYSVKPEKNPNFENILGVDLGKVKFFSATVLHPDLTYSDEFVPSKELDRITNKIARLNRNVESNYQLFSRAVAYNPDQKPITKKQIAHKLEYDRTRNKRTRLKIAAEKLAAVEIVNVALKNKCAEIHLENLTWVNNSAGKWDFSKISKEIQNVAEIFGIAVKFINPKNTSERHPETHELGTQVNRKIVFEDGTFVDRDRLASLNIALIQPSHYDKDLDKRVPQKIYKTELRNKQMSVKAKRSQSRRSLNKQRKTNILDFKQQKRRSKIVFACLTASHTLTLSSINQRYVFVTADGLETTALPKQVLKVTKVTVQTN